MLVNCVTSQDGKKLAAIAKEDIHLYLSRPDCFVWVALRDPLPEDFRDVHDHLFRINQSIDSLREMVTTAISVNPSLITLQENETTKRLAAYAALVAVPTMIAGVYGMNFEHMPELKWAFGNPLH